mmetsp:Transcript_13872/g.20264  ORF Transcript_13872/g.20264 Transcript_13872/m.20264 type:complete len:93 (-) Transcript_13872:821-1099(-)
MSPTNSMSLYFSTTVAGICITDPLACTNFVLVVLHFKICRLGPNMSSVSALSASVRGQLCSSFHFKMLQKWAKFNPHWDFLVGKSIWLHQLA